MSDEASALLSVRDLRVEFPIRSRVLRRVVGALRAVDGVTFAVDAGETLGLVGESGSGKSTTARAVLRLLEPTSGTIDFDGDDLAALDGAELRTVRRDLQMVFQDPFSSLSPQMHISQIVTEPLVVHEGLPRQRRTERAGELLALVGLDPAAAVRYPHEFSGGQRQRIAVARALALRPRLLICDEPLSSLDVSTQSQVVNLLADLQADLDLAYVFISHDLSVVRHVSDRIAVMYLGRIVEIGDADQVYDQPKHPYTEALLSAIPEPDPEAQRSRKRIVLSGDVPSPADPPAGCHFHTRCPYAMDRCRTEDPPAFVAPDGTAVTCHLHRHGPSLAGASVRGLDAAVADGTPQG